MKYPKTTISKDGEKRISINIEYRINKQTLINVLASMLDYILVDIVSKKDLSLDNDLPLDLDWYTIQPQFSKYSIYKELQRLLRDKGDNIWNITESFLNEEYKDEIMRWAKNHILFYFPEFK